MTNQPRTVSTYEANKHPHVTDVHYSLPLSLIHILITTRRQRNRPRLPQRHSPQAASACHVVSPRAMCPNCTCWPGRCGCHRQPPHNQHVKHAATVTALWCLAWAGRHPPQSPPPSTPPFAPFPPSPFSKTCGGLLAARL